MTLIHRAALPLSAILCASAVPVLPASAASQEIVVTASPREVALADWSQRVRNDLERNMRPPNRLETAFDEGVVAVGFRCTESGRPDAVSIIQSSGSNALDRAALRSVRRLTSLHPTVEGMRPDQKVVAQLLYLNSAVPEREIARHLKAADAKAKASNGWFTREEIASGEVLLLGAVH